MIAAIFNEILRLLLYVLCCANNMTRPNAESVNGITTVVSADGLAVMPLLKEHQND